MQSACHSHHLLRSAVVSDDYVRTLIGPFTPQDYAVYGDSRPARQASGGGDEAHSAVASTGPFVLSDLSLPDAPGASDPSHALQLYHVTMTE